MNNRDEQDLLELGKFYFLNKKFEKAIEVFKKALKEDTINAEITYNLALAYEAVNDLDNAHIFYKKTIALNPEHKLAGEHLRKLVGGDEN